MNKCVLLILDGYGESESSYYNAVKNAKTPFLDHLKSYSHSLLKTSGEDVGLFDGDLGGSEVGHMTIGAGRVVPTTAKLISDEIKSKKFEQNPVLKKTLLNLSKNNANLHLFGLMSDKNIHSNIFHAIEIVKIASSYAKNIFIHFVTDGRDSGQFESVEYYKMFRNATKDVKNCHILSVCGRFYAMDRENHQERTDKAFHAMFDSNSGISENDVLNFLNNQHESGHNDQYVEPTHVKVKEYEGVDKNDCIMFFNFREDRLRQITKACFGICNNIVTMSSVGGVKSKVLYPAKIVKNTLCEYLSKKGAKIMKISESTKYAHVTYFFNGGREQPFENEDRIHIKSLAVDDFATTPKMRAKEISCQLLKAIKKDYDLIVVNFSNPDMIGHTGNYESTIRALEYLDKCVKKTVNFAKKHDYFVLLTADHGNSETMRTENGEPHLAHTLNPVVCLEATKHFEMKPTGALKDVAPTILDLMGIEPNKYFTGSSLLKK